MLFDRARVSATFSEGFRPFSLDGGALLEHMTTADRARRLLEEVPKLREPLTTRIVFLERDSIAEALAQLAERNANPIAVELRRALRAHLRTEGRDLG